MLRVRDLGGVEAAVDVHQGAAFVGEGVGFCVGQAAGMGEAEGYLAVAVEVAQVGSALETRAM